MYFIIGLFMHCVYLINLCVGNSNVGDVKTWGIVGWDIDIAWCFKRLACYDSAFFLSP